MHLTERLSTTARRVRSAIRRVTSLALAVVAAVLLASHSAAAADPPSLMIVLDGSGSMWARMRGDRQAKITLVRDDLLKSLGALSPQMRVGLTLFGHRRQGSCSDAEVVRPLEPLAAKPIAGTIEAINPKGRGPITLALREALSELSKTGGQQSLLLIHDDLDNCQQDPCSLVGDIKSGHPNLVVHVVSIDLKPEENSHMLCLPRATGGQHHPVRSAEELTAALAEVVRAAASRSAPARPAALPNAAPAPRAVPAVPTAPGLHLTAALPVADWVGPTPVAWRILPAGKSDGPAAFVGEGRAVSAKLPPGRYVIEARLGMISVRQEIVADPAKSQPVRVAFTGGALELAWPAEASGVRFGDTIVAVRALQGTGKTAPPATYLSRGRHRMIAVAPGTYAVTVSSGRYREQHTVTVAAGARQQVALSMGSGAAELVAVAVDGGQPLADALFIIVEDDPEAPQGRREVARSAAVRPLFELPAGTYTAIVRQGAAEVRERLAVRPGETVRRVIRLGSGRLSLTAGALPQAPEDQVVQWRVEPVDPGSAPPATVRLIAPKLDIPLAAGRYRIEARFGRQNAAARREVTIKAGETEALAIEPDAGIVRLKAEDLRAGTTAAARLGAPDAHWTILDAAKEPVWSTTDPEPTAWLQEGAYILRVEVRGRIAEQPLQIKRGLNAAVVVAVP